jgi:hypothetical protein
MSRIENTVVDITCREGILYPPKDPLCFVNLVDRRSQLLSDPQLYPLHFTY